MNAGVMSLSAAREPFGIWDRFGVAAITLVGLLSLAVALHIDQVDREHAASPLVTAR